jgi:hypothetical protein
MEQFPLRVAAGMASLVLLRPWKWASRQVPRSTSLSGLWAGSYVDSRQLVDKG